MSSKSDKEYNRAMAEFGLVDEEEQDKSKDLFRDEGLGALVFKAVEKLHEAWQTEVNAPDILPYKDKLIDDLTSKLLEQQNNLDLLMDTIGNDDDDDDGVSKSDKHFALTLYQMDCERIRYGLARYLRSRLLKIQNNLNFILNSTSSGSVNSSGSSVSMSYIDRLSSNEKQFAKTLNELNNKFMSTQLKNRLLEDTKHFYKTDDIILNSKPNLNLFVYYQSIEDNVEVLVNRNGRDRLQSAPKGEIGIACYGQILAQHVLEGKVRLL